MNPYFENSGKVYSLDYYAGRNKCLKFAEDSKLLENGNEVFNNADYLFDSSFQLIDKTYLESLYNKNGITTVAYSLPFFPKESFLRDTYLYSRGYFGLKASCFNEIKNKKIAKELMEDLNSLEVYFTYSDTSKMIFSVLGLIFSLVVLIDVVLICNTKINQNGDVKIHFSAFFMYYAFSGLFIITNLGLSISTAIIISQFNYNHNLDSVFNNLDCVDAYDYQVFQRLLNNLVYASNVNIAIFILASFCVCLIIAYITLLCFIMNEVGEE